jgi:glutamate-ammonia-ligase adenylyltransferase
VWEAQALLRARPVAGDGVGLDGEVIDGDESLASRFLAVIDPIRYPADGLSSIEITEIRRIKARVESERLPRGARPERHLKLGRGSVSDVEWTAQLLQLRHGGVAPTLRTTQTIAALDAALDAELIESGDHEALTEAWTLAARLRSAVVLWTGRTTGSTVDVLPTNGRDLSGLAGIIGKGSGQELEQRYLRTARLGRAAVERVFYEFTDPD